MRPKTTVAKIGYRIQSSRSSFEEVQKTVKGYNYAPEVASPEALPKLTGLYATVLSRSSKFFSDINLIAGGRNKVATDLSMRLGCAL